MSHLYADIQEYLCELLTLFGYPEGFRVARQNLVHSASELVQQLQTLLLPHARVIEPWQARLGNRMC